MAAVIWKLPGNACFLLDMKMLSVWQGSEKFVGSRRSAQLHKESDSLALHHSAWKRSSCGNGLRSARPAGGSTPARSAKVEKAKERPVGRVWGGGTAHHRRRRGPLFRIYDFLSEIGFSCKILAGAPHLDVGMAADWALLRYEGL
ncbi:unnamed protein product [Gongylonema pulchrum]|uniref:Uncharacterized protein n=1 Tax=Gongylonema pulchrum TaxID=637853 RepID=A0A183DV11_9BILA|nr:unnamed protein product [Gongylonema pulchrum]